jgi:Mrp family chromosome partitioning ATPase
VLEEARSTYDLVVIDTPPLAAVSDAFPLLRKVDGVIIVGRSGRNRRDVARRLRETLAGAQAPLLGVVANGFKVGRLSSYEHPYGATYGGTFAAAEGISVTAESDNGGSSSGAPQRLRNPSRTREPEPAEPGHDVPSGRAPESR